MNKRNFAISVISLGMLTLVACGKSDYAKRTDEMIAKIGTVTIDSGDAIIEAENLYNGLTDKDKEQVENLEVLENARKTYDQLVENNIKESLDSAYDMIETTNGYCNELVALIHDYWSYNGFEAFADDNSFKNMDTKYNTSKEYKAGTFYGDAKICYDNRSMIRELLPQIKIIFNNINSVPKEYEAYYNAVKELYLNLDTYANLAISYPEGYSLISYTEAYNNHQSEYSSLKSDVEFEKNSF